MRENLKKARKDAGKNIQCYVSRDIIQIVTLILQSIILAKLVLS